MVSFDRSISACIYRGICHGLRVDPEPSPVLDLRSSRPAAPSPPAPVAKRAKPTPAAVEPLGATAAHDLRPRRRPATAAIRAALDNAGRQGAFLDKRDAPASPPTTPSRATRRRGPPTASSPTARSRIIARIQQADTDGLDAARLSDAAARPRQGRRRPTLPDLAARRRACSARRSSPTPATPIPAVSIPPTVSQNFGYELHLPDPVEVLSQRRASPTTRPRPSPPTIRSIPNSSRFATSSPNVRAASTAVKPPVEIPAGATLQARHQRSARRRSCAAARRCRRRRDGRRSLRRRRSLAAVKAFQKSARPQAGRHRRQRHARRHRTRPPSATTSHHPRQHGTLALDAAGSRPLLRPRQHSELQSRRLPGRQGHLHHAHRRRQGRPTRRRSSPTRSRTSSSTRCGTSRPRSRSRRCCRRSGPIPARAQRLPGLRQLQRPLPRRSTRAWSTGTTVDMRTHPDQAAAGRARTPSARSSSCSPTPTPSISTTRRRRACSQQRLPRLQPRLHAGAWTRGTSPTPC